MNSSFDSAFETHVDYCRMRVWSSIYRPIWETNPALSQVRVIRGTTSPAGLILVDTPISEEHADDAQPVSGLVRFRQKRNATDLTWAQQLNTQRVAAITKWVKIILIFPAAFDLGRKWDKDAPLGTSIAAGLKHVFSGKATGTLHNRAGPILRFIQWCHAHGVIPFPVREHHVYEFMKAIGFEAAPTFLRSFLVSMTFCNFILGLTGSDEVTSSQRVQGCARESYLTKRKLCQRPPLTVDQVKALEIYVADMLGPPRDVYAAGCFLLCVFMRARFSDMLHMTDIVADEISVDGMVAGYIESKVTRSKSAYTTERKTMLPPMAAPLIGTSGRNWFRSWQKARLLCSVPKGTEMPLLPQPAANGWLKTPMSAAAGGDWLRKILMALRFSQTEVQNIGTHSCKATCLSWMAKAGVDLSCRRLLGYHVDPTTKTCLVYSRDAVSGPLRELDRVLKMIRALEFSPDSTRSGYFLNVATGSAPVDQESQHDTEDGDDASDSEDSEDEEPSEEQHAAAEKAIDEVVGEWSEHSTLEGLGLGDDAALFQNRNTRYYHICANESEMHFRCGRDISASYIKVERRPRFFSPQCRTCFKPQ